MPDPEYLKRCRPEIRDKIRSSRAAAERKRRARRARATAIAKASDYSITLRHIEQAYNHAHFHRLDPNLRSAIAKCHRAALRARDRNHRRVRDDV